MSVSPKVADPFAPHSAGRDMGLELARLLAALFVVYGHLVWSATFDSGLASFVKFDGERLIAEQTHWLWKPQAWLSEFAGGAHITVVGVTVFFLITGWLTPALVTSATRGQYLVRRVFRVVPLLVVASILTFWCVNLAGGTAQSGPFDVFATATLSYRELGAACVLPVVWSLAIELKFYALAAAVGNWTERTVIWACAGCLLATVLLLRLIPGGEAWAADISFFPLILLGVAMRCGYDLRGRMFGVGFLVALSCFAGCQLVVGVHGVVVHQLVTPANGLLAVILFVLLRRFGGAVSPKVMKASNLTYSMYLLHLAPGLAIVAIAAPHVGSAWAVCLAFGATLALSWAAYEWLERPFVRVGQRLAAKLS